MDLFFTIGQLIFGIIITLIAFKIYNPFKGKGMPEAEIEWYRKFGTLMKVIGIILLVISAFGFIPDSNITEENWSEEEKKEMTNSCVESALKNTTDKIRAKNYCECVTHQLSSQYSKTQFDSINKTSQESQMKILNPLIESCR